MTTASDPSDARIEVNGLDFHYRDWGGDAPVPAIALHGFALNCHSWDEVAPRLSDLIHVRALDQRGHGLSAWAADVADYNRDSMVSDVEGIVSALALERPVLLGHSMGGMNAMTYAARHPDQVRALILVDIGPEVSVDGADEVRRFVAGPYEMDSLDAWVDLTHQYYPHRSKERIRQRLTVSLRETPDGKQAKQYDERFREAGFGGVARARDDIWDVAKALRCPTLLLRGGESPVLKQEQAEQFAAAVDVVRLVTIEGAGHSVAGDKPDEFVDAARAFLHDVL